MVPCQLGDDCGRENKKWGESVQRWWQRKWWRVGRKLWNIWGNFNNTWYSARFFTFQSIWYFKIAYMIMWSRLTFTVSSCWNPTCSPRPSSNCMPYQPSLSIRADDQKKESVVLSRVQLFVLLWIVAHQSPLSTGFSRQMIRRVSLFCLWTNFSL